MEKQPLNRIKVMLAERMLTNKQLADMLGGVLDEVVGVLPVAIPVLITFIALRKGISFIQSILHSA